MDSPSHRLMLYRDMAVQASFARDAARNRDWEILAQAEGRVSALRDLLNALPEISGVAPEEALEMQALIEEALAHLDETRQLVLPHLEELRVLLGDASTRRRVDAAYGQNDTP